MAKTTRIPRKIFDKMKKAGMPTDEFEPSDLPMDPMTAFLVDVLGVNEMLDGIADGKKAKESEKDEEIPPDERVDRSDVGMPVWFSPPQECRTGTTPLFYAATITTVHPDLKCDLVTFGPNSVYFQHKIEQSENIKPGYWCLPYDLEEGD